MNCTCGTCTTPTSRILTWKELIRPGWTLTTQRELCRLHADITARRLREQGVALTVERIGQDAA